MCTAVKNVGATDGPPAPFRFQVDNAGQLLFPPTDAPLPRPAPLNFSELDRERARRWQKAQKMEAELTRPDEAAKAYTDFLSLAPPKAFAASGSYALGLLLEKQGDSRAAADIFQRFTKEYPDAVGESGLPLAPLAALKVLELETNRPLAE